MEMGMTGSDHGNQRRQQHEQESTATSGHEEVEFAGNTEDETVFQVVPVGEGQAMACATKVGPFSAAGVPALPKTRCTGQSSLQRAAAAAQAATTEDVTGVSGE